MIAQSVQAPSPSDIDRMRVKMREAVAEEFPSRARMLDKNWPRYRACVLAVLERFTEEERGDVLDYGGGFPFVARALRDSGCCVTVYEPYQTDELRAVARALSMSDCLLDQLPSGRRFGSLVLIDVIEHLAVIKPVMQHVRALAGPSAPLLVSTPNVLRLDMWVRFVLRRTGHPQAIDKFLASDDCFTHHQREFTLAELRMTLRHFGFEPEWDAILDTSYHHATSSRYTRFRRCVRRALARAFPSLANNLLVVARAARGPAKPAE